MVVGFTGTREGMTIKQLVRISQKLAELQKSGFSRAKHGVCIGADEDFHVLAKAIGFYAIGHPGVNKFGKCPTRADVVCDEMLPEKPFLVRDKDIVDGSKIMLATPKGPEELRSGTWATVRYARKQKKPLMIVYPDGRVEEESV